MGKSFRRSERLRHITAWHKFPCKKVTPSAKTVLPVLSCPRAGCMPAVCLAGNCCAKLVLNSPVVPVPGAQQGLDLPRAPKLSVLRMVWTCLQAPGHCEGQACCFPANTLSPALPSPRLSSSSQRSRTACSPWWVQTWPGLSSGCAWTWWSPWWTTQGVSSLSEDLYWLHA